MPWFPWLATKIFWTERPWFVWHRRLSAVVGAAQRGQAVVHAGDDVVVLVQLDRVREERPAVVPGDQDRARPGRVDQAAPQLGEPRAFLLEVGHHPRDVADRARGDAVRARRDAVRGRPDAVRGRPDAVRGRPDAVRGRPDAVRGREPVVDRVDLAEFHDDRSPRGEGGRVVEYDVVVPLAVDD